MKFANPPLYACRSSSGQKPQYGLMMLAYQHFTAVLLFYGSPFVSGVCYCLSVFWCAVARTSWLLVKVGKSGNEIREKTAVYKWVTRFSEGRESVTDEERSGRPATSRTEENIAEVRQIVRENHRLTFRSIAEQANIDKETEKSKLNILT
jgi:hypothetical protein